MGVVYTSHQCHNDVLIREVASLYFRPGDRIADVTYGRGGFWRQLDLGQYEFFASDLTTCPEALHDFRALPYADGSMDVLVLDPPYVHNPDEIEARKQYMSHIEIYDIAIKELGYGIQDLFVLTQMGKPIVHSKTQKHARKNHSYLWIFRR